jgi:hypothetical protein
MHLGVPGQANGHARRGSHNTTFTDMMEESGLAGLKKGQRMYARGEDDVFVDRI